MLQKGFSPVFNTFRITNATGPVDEANFFEWEAYISGPEGTPFEGGIFPATLSFPKVCPLIATHVNNRITR